MEKSDPFKAAEGNPALEDKQRSTDSLNCRSSKAAALKALPELRRNTSPRQPPEARSVTIEATASDELRCWVSC